jgi:hypothetical protein
VAEEEGSRAVGRVVDENEPLAVVVEMPGLSDGNSGKGEMTSSGRASKREPCCR